MPFLEVSNVYKTYEDSPLLRGVSFTVEQGEIVCLLGPSGSGKTTLLRIVAGLETMAGGQVVLEGQDLAGVSAYRRGVVLMFQEYALFPHRTVAENVAFGLQMRGASPDLIAGRVAEVLNLVGMEAFGDRDVNELSGGERQRVALARSLAPEPRLLLLDEPLGALDRNLRERLMEELPAILRRVGVTAITVTHDQEEAFAMADRVVLLNEGRVAQIGAPAEVYAAPASRWVARFLGLDNLFPATVTGRAEVDVPFGTLILNGGQPLPAPETEGTLLVHPWGVHLESGERNAFSAEVARCTFHGQRYRLELALPGGTLHVSRDPGKPVLEVGEQVRGWIEPAALRWLEGG